MKMKRTDCLAEKFIVLHAEEVEGELLACLYLLNSDGQIVANIPYGPWSKQTALLVQEWIVQPMTVRFTAPSKKEFFLFCDWLKRHLHAANRDFVPTIRSRFIEAGRLNVPDLVSYQRELSIETPDAPSSPAAILHFHYQYFLLWMQRVDNLLRLEQDPIEFEKNRIKELTEKELLVEIRKTLPEYMIIIRPVNECGYEYELWHGKFIKGKGNSLVEAYLNIDKKRDVS